MLHDVNGPILINSVLGTITGGQNGIVAGGHPAHSLASHIGYKHRAEPVPPQPHRLMADVDPALGQQVFRRLSGKRAYIITIRRITSGDELK